VGEQLLATFQGDADGPARRLAALALGEIGAQDSERVPVETQTELERCFATAPEDPDLRRAVEKALARLRAGRPGA
jgi:HEAT repeat protein